MDDFRNYAKDLNAPVDRGQSVAPDDTADLPNASRVVYLGTAGDLSIVTTRGDAVTLTALAAGVPHPIRAARILAAGTTAGQIVVMW